MDVPFKILAVAALSAGLGTGAWAAPSATYTVFGAAPSGASGPDSVTVGAGSVWVSYDGGSLSSDGSQPAGVSIIARFSPAGMLQNTYQIGGDVDGLKYNAATGDI